MSDILIRSNYGGRLFQDTFSQVFLEDDELFVPGKLHQISLASNELGTAEVMAVRKFNYRDIRDSISYLITGQPSYYLAGQLCKEYNSGKVLPNDTILVHVVYQWRHRNHEIQQYFLQEWWKEVTSAA